MAKDAASTVVLLGAGASADVVPKTKKLTQCLFSHAVPISDNPMDPDYGKNSRLVFEELAIQHPDARDNFERLLDWAMVSAERTHLAEERARYLNAVMQGAQLIGLQISKALKTSQGPSASVRLLEWLGHRVALSVASLNWDDLPLRTAKVEWRDGFDHRQRSGYIADQARKNPVIVSLPLYWLHGSLHFSWQLPDSNVHIDHQGQRSQLPFIQWEPEVYTALGRWTTRADSDDADRLTVRFPIVTAGGKVGQVFVPPFLDYWTHFLNDVRIAHALCVVGYSGGDDHCNMVLREAIRTNRRLRTVVWIDCTPGLSPESLYKTLLAKLRKVFQWGSKWQTPVTPSIDAFYPFALDSQTTLWVYPEGLDSLVADRQRLTKLADLLGATPT